MSQQIIFTNDIVETLEELHDQLKPSKTVFFTDDNVDEKVLGPLISPALKGGPLEDALVISKDEGEMYKTVGEVCNVWDFFQEEGLTRSSLVINIGGGVVTDMGGFAAACFKRGMRFINVPTTILCAVDAAIGGKTGVNHNGLKNEIGVFREAEAVIVSTSTFYTLPMMERLSGFAEMIKHAMLSSSEDFDEVLDNSVTDEDFDEDVWLPLLKKSIEVKRRIVAADPTESGLRKALNLGHTAGHAFESLAMRRNRLIPHGFAVAWGLVVAVVLSKMRNWLPANILYRLASYVRTNYDVFHITCDDYPQLLDFMHHDKKNFDTESVRFTLLKGLGRPEIDCQVSDDEICAALDVYRDLFGI